MLKKSISWILSVTLVFAGFCGLTVTAADNGVIIIDENTDLAALGLDDSIVFVKGDGAADISEEANTDSDNAAGVSALSEDVAVPKASATNTVEKDATPTAISPNVPEEGTRLAEGSYADASFSGTQTLGGTTENKIYTYKSSDNGIINITSSTTWTINGSVRFSSQIKVATGATLTIKHGTAVAHSSYSVPVVRIVCGTAISRTSGNKALFFVDDGGILNIYGNGGTSTTYDYGMGNGATSNRLVITGSEVTDTPVIWFGGGPEKSQLNLIGVDIRNANNINSENSDRNAFNSGCQGGAICINADMSKVNIIGCLFSNCKALDGGAIAFRVYEQTNANALIDKCVFYNCKATSGTGYGGAIYCMGTGDGTYAPKFYGLTVSNCAFNNCDAKNGGAFFAADKTEDGLTNGPQFTNGISITNTSFSGCDATGRAGAIFFRPYKCNNFTVSGCTFTSCTASLDGGAIILAGNAAVKHTKVTINAVFNNCTVQEYGGAVSINSGSYTDGIYLDGSTFTNCTSAPTDSTDTSHKEKSEGGAVFVRPVACNVFSMVGCAFSECTSELYGGAVSFHPNNNTAFTKIDFTNSSFTSCKADTDGGAIAFRERPVGTVSSDSVLLSGCTFSDCQLTDTSVIARGGAAVYISGKFKSVVYNGGRIENCSGGEGVGLMIDGSGDTVIPEFTVTNVDFTGNTMTNGRYGGVIKTEGLTCIRLTLNNCRFTNNTNTNNSSSHINSAGCIYWNAGDISTLSGYVVDQSVLTIKDCVFDNNLVENGPGGAIYNESSLVVQRCVFGNNKAKSDCGGAIAMQNYANINGLLPPDVSLNLDADTYFYNNEALNGGAISFYCRNSSNANNYGKLIPFKLILEGTQIYNNKAIESGGGIYLNTAEDAVEYFDFGIELKNGDIYGNTAVDGAGIYATSEKTALKVKIIGGVIGGQKANDDGTVVNTPNAASNCGGGIHIRTNLVSLEMTGGEISYNTAGDGGGGIYSEASSIVYSGGAVSNNEAVNRGGGLYIVGGTVEFTGGSIDNNKTNYGGGAFFTSASLVKLKDKISIANNQANTSGGGLYVTNNSEVTIQNGEINDNSATLVGGGVRVAHGASFTMTGGTVNGNACEGDTLGQNTGGGGIYVTGSTGKICTLAINGGEISGNRANYIGTGTPQLPIDSDGHTIYNGGGLYVGNYVTFTMSAGTVSDNTTNRSGGGIFVRNNTITISGGNIGGTSADTGNEAVYGGGIFVGENANVNMTGGSISYNTAELDGGGICANGKATASKITVSLAGGNVDNNTSTNGNGGGIYAAYATITLDGGDIYENHALTGDGGGIYATDEATVTVNDGDVYYNQADEGRGGGIFATGTTASVAINGGHLGLEDNPNIANYGGGVYIDSAKFVLEKTETASGSISYNLAVVDGGGGYFYNTEVEIKGDVSENVAQGSGGGIYLNMAKVTLYGDLDSNTSVFLQELRTTVGNGGGAYLVNESTLIMEEGGNITGNTTDGNGGGIAVYDSSVATLSGGIITENLAANGFGGGVYANGSVVTISGSDITTNSAKNGGGVCVTLGGELYMTGGFLRYNTAVGMPASDVTTAFHLDETLAGVGGGIYLSNGVDADLSTYELTGDTYGIYGNLADFAADDVFANGVYTQLWLPAALSMKLAGTEFERATGWFEDYANGDTRYGDGLNGNGDIGGARYKQTQRTVIAYVNAEDAGDNADDSTVYINDANTYVCLTLGVAKQGYGELTIIKSGSNIDPEQVFVFTVVGETALGDKIEFSVTIQGTGAITVTDVPDGTYTVTETVDWSWRYKLTGINVTNGVVSLADCCGSITVGAADPSPDIEFINALENDSWLDGNSGVVENVAGTAPVNTVSVNSAAQLTANLPKKEELV